VPPEVAQALILRGTMEEIRAGVQRYLDLGVDTAFLQFSTSEPNPQTKRERILSAIRALAPAAR
jgi:alkanesulfonate monooxygenase SsuD/methylene tetrahydromethanopterin reductase-like flavin-dependent oxidoreductase (luciferase family)